MAPIIAAVISTLMNKGMENIQNVKNGSNKQAQISPSDIKRMISAGTNTSGNTDFNVNRGFLTHPDVNYVE